MEGVYTWADCSVSSDHLRRHLRRQVVFSVLLSLLLVHPGNALYRRAPTFGTLARSKGSRTCLISSLQRNNHHKIDEYVLRLRAGSTGGDKDDDDQKEDGQEDAEEEVDSSVVEKEEDAEEEEEDEYDVEEDEEEEDIVLGDGVKIEMSVKKYDDPVFPSPFLNIYVTFGIMMLAKKIDLNNPIVIKICRMVYILYVVGLQMFLLYVRVKAKAANDRTPITVSNPLSGLLKNQLDGVTGSTGSVMKTLASSFLSSSTSILEYDLKEANSMQRGIVFNMGFLWLLHFKMKQTQPILLQAASGLINLFYSPLFQVYALGRNLERPFKTQSAERMAQMEGAAGTEKAVEEPKIQKITEQKPIAELAEQNDDSDSDEETEVTATDAESDDEQEEGEAALEEDDDDEDSAEEDDEDTDKVDEKGSKEAKATKSD